MYLIDPETGGAAPVKVFPRSEEDTLRGFQWAPGGDLVVRVRDALLRVDIASGAEQHLLDLPQGTRGFDVSPTDGAIASLSDRDDLQAAPANRFGGIITIRVPGEPARELLRIPAGAFLRDLDLGARRTIAPVHAHADRLFAQRRGQMARRVASRCHDR